MEGECYDVPPRPSSASLSGPFPCPCMYWWNRHTWHLAQSHNGSTWREQPTQGERPWIWERLRTGGGGSNRRWDGWIALLTQGTWVWANSGREWRTGEPGMLQSTGSQRVRHKRLNIRDGSLVCGVRAIKAGQVEALKLFPLLDETVSQYQYFILKMADVNATLKNLKD